MILSPFILTLPLILPNLSIIYDIQRLFLQLVVFLAPLFLIGMDFITKKINKENILKNNIEKMYVLSPHCFSTFKDTFNSEEMKNIKIAPLIELVHQLISSSAIQMTGKIEKKVAFHDPCFFSKHLDIINQPREILKMIPGLGKMKALKDMTPDEKEIWVTEWSPRGGSPTNLDRPDLDNVPPQMNAQLIARTELAFLRHPEVTKAQYFTLYSSDHSVFQVYVQAGNQFAPEATAVVIGWFDDAANGGTTFQRVVEANGQVIGDLGPFKESYRPIEGGLFRSSARMVLILQNASAEARVYDPMQGNAGKPARVELLVTSDLGNTAHAAAQVTRLDANAPIVLPPLSIARVIWEK